MRVYYIERPPGISTLKMVYLPDCEERFSRIKDLAEHEKSEHADDEPPPSAVPRPPDLKPPVALPQIVPSYTTTTRLASKPSITAERHARLGPWVDQYLCSLCFITLMQSL